MPSLVTLLLLLAELLSLTQGEYTIDHGTPDQVQAAFHERGGHQAARAFMYCTEHPAGEAPCELMLPLEGAAAGRAMYAEWLRQGRPLHVTEDNLRPLPALHAPVYADSPAYLRWRDAWIERAWGILYIDALVHELIHVYDWLDDPEVWGSPMGGGPRGHHDPAHWYVDRVYELGRLR